MIHINPQQPTATKVTAKNKSLSENCNQRRLGAVMEANLAKQDH
jgi:hypothetical protein